MKSLFAIAVAGTAASFVSAATFSGGGFTIFPDDGDNDRAISFDISGLTGNFTGFILTVDLGGDRPNPSELDFDIRATGRTDVTLPFFQFLDDNNFSYSYDSNDILTVTDDFLNGDPLRAGDYNTLRLTFFNDTGNSDIDVNSYTLTLVPTPGAVGLLAGAGCFVSRRRR